MKTLPVITIGHVDHGKTSLVRALTGIDTDTLPEEKTRGVSITLGFAHRTYENTIIDFIDAPGHENFINAMVSGASGAQAALLVIAANEGIKPQTLEHLQIAKYLGLTAGIIALTKSDLLQTEDHAACEAGIRAALTDTCLATAPIILCSSETGQGLDALNTALAALSPDQTAPPPASYYPIDRVFTAEGRGTIVTGTLLGAPITSDTKLTHSPSITPVSLRTLQTHGKETAQADNGQRAALNLRNAPAKIKRGDILHTPGAFTPSNNIDVHITLASTSRPLKHMAKIRILYASANAVATLRLFDGNHIAAGTSAFAQLRFETPITTYAGQRAIIRNLSPAETLGGLTILDPAATAPKNKPARRATLIAVQSGDPAQIATALATEYHGIAQTADLARLSRQQAPALPDGFTHITETTITPVATIASATQVYIAHLQAYHHAHSLRPAAPRTHMAALRLHADLITHIETALIQDGALTATPSHLALTAHTPRDHLSPDQTHSLQTLTQAFADAGLQPPPPHSFIANTDDADLIDLLVHEGTLTRLHNVSLNQTIIFHTPAMTDALETLRQAFTPPTPFTTSQARAALGTTRKYIVPLLEHFDTAGFTHRSGNSRHITPRA